MVEDTSKIPEVSKKQATRELNQGSVVVVDCDTASYRLLNNCGSFLWGQINGENSVEDIARSLTNNFEVDYEAALKDTKIFLEEVVRKDMVTWKN